MRISRDTLRAWVLSRAAVLALMAVAAYLQTRYGTGRPLRAGSTGFFAWDAGWYRTIASHGYVTHDVLRFFPLVALPGRLLSPLGSFVAGACVVVVANASALLYAEGLARLTLAELRDETASRFVPYVALLNPAAYVLVIGYAEATAGALAVWCFLALRRGRWLPAAGLAYLSGLARPTGVLVALPALVEALRTRRDLAARALAVAAAPLGCATYLLWCGIARGDPLLPFETQQADDLRNAVVVWPWHALSVAWHALLEHGRVAHMLHLVWVPLVLVLLYVVARRLPASYTAYAAATVVLAIGTPNLASFERYALSAFPLLMVAATARPRSVRLVTSIGCCLGLAGYAVLAFTAQYVP